MASIRVSELTPTATAAADSFLYLADTDNGGVDFDSKKITVANFLNAYATETFVNSAIENLINGAPEALDTLKEISDAIGDSGDIVGNLIGMINANEVHMDNMASLSGVAKDETGLGSFSGSTIGDSSDIKSALQALETSLELKASSSAVNSNVSNTNDLVSLSGVAAGSVNMGLFDGDTLSDNATLKVVLQSAESAIEANASAISQEVSDRAAEITALTNGAVASNTAAINQEVTDRAAAITALTNGAVATNTSGVSTNAAAITSLSNGAVASNTAAIAQEVTDRQAAVSAEATARADADALLMPKAGGTFTGPISGPAPTSDLHLATKKYADDLVANVDLSQVETNRVGLINEANTRANADSALSGRLDTLEADPTTQTLLDAETAARIAGDALLLPLTGGTLSGDLNIGSGSGEEITVTAGAHHANTPLFVAYEKPAGETKYLTGLKVEKGTASFSQLMSVFVNGGYVTETATVSNATSADGSSGWSSGTATGGIDQSGSNTLTRSPDFILVEFDNPIEIVDGVNNMKVQIHGYTGNNITLYLSDDASGGGSGAASTIGVDGTATFGGNITAAAVPTDAAHVVNKLYADNLVAGVDLSGIATNAAAIEALTNGAPDLLNTLNEIAAAIGDDENFAATITGQISTESTTRASADTALSGRLDTLEADPTTGSALTAETNARTSADTALSGRLDVLEADPTTATALSSAVTTLNNSISAEATARADADALLMPKAGGVFTGAVTGIAPTSDLHFATKKYADDLVANVDLSQVEQNRLDIIQEISDRAAAITALTNGAVATNATNISANATAISQEVTDRAAAITALTNGQVATNTSGIATNATAITNLTNGAVADNAAAITALANGAVASNTAAITQEVTDRQAAITALTNGAVADNAAAVTALANGAVATNAAAIAQETTDRIAADALKVDKQSTVNEHMLGQTSAQSAPVDAQGNSNYLFLVVDKATGALKSIDKTFLEAE